MLIKICGLTDKKEAEYLNRNKVDFAGFVVFYPKSKRNVSMEKATEIMKELNPTIKRVAVFVSPTVEQLTQAKAAGFDIAQIHGVLDEELIKKCPLPIIKAFNIDDMDKFDFYNECEKIVGFVFDAKEPGSGKVFDWNLLKTIPRTDKLFILSGGLTKDNVVEGIRFVNPDGVDVSSGVEFLDSNIKGKDPERIDEFVKKVREES